MPEPVHFSSAPSGTGAGPAGARPQTDDHPQRAAIAVANPGEDVWSGLLQTGLNFLEQLAAASRAGSPQKEKSAPSIDSFVDRDERTGENFLRIPMPKPEMLDKALGALLISEIEPSDPT